MTPMPCFVLRSDCGSRRAQRLTVFCAYHIGLILFLLASVYIAVKGGAFRALGIVLVVVAIAFELAMWQWRCASTHRMEDGGEDVLSQLYAHERPRNVCADISMDYAQKPEMGLKQSDTGAVEEMVYKAMRDSDGYFSVDTLVRPLLPTVTREEAPLLGTYHGLQ